MKNKGIIGFASVFSLLAFSAAVSAPTAKMNLDILVTGGDMISPWKDRADFYNETIVAESNGQATKVDVKFAKENFSRVGNPFVPPDKKLVANEIGYPYFTAIPGFMNLALNAFPPDKIDPVEAEKLTYTFKIYSDDQGENMVDVPLYGKNIIWDLNDKNLKNGIYYIELTVSNNSSSISTDLTPINLIFSPPDGLYIMPYVDNDLTVYPNPLEKLLAGSTYEFTLFDSDLKVLTVEVDKVDVDRMTTEVTFDMTGRAPGIYKVGVTLSNELYSKTMEPVDFVYVNKAPSHNGWRAYIDEIPSKTDLDMIDIKELKVGEGISAISEEATDPERNPITYGFILYDKNKNIVKREKELNREQMLLDTYNLISGEYTIHTFIYDGFNEVISDEFYDIKLFDANPEPLTLKAYSQGDNVFRIEPEINREIQNKGFIYKIEVIDSEGTIALSSEGEPLILDANILDIGKNYEIKVRSELKGKPSVFTETCVADLDGVAVENCTIPSLSPVINTPPSMPSFDFRLEFTKDAQGKVIGDAVFDGTTESVDPEGNSINYSYLLFQNGELKYTFTGFDARESVSKITPGYYKVVMIADDRRFKTTHFGRITELSDYQWDSQAEELSLVIEIPELSNLSNPSFVMGKYYWMMYVVGIETPTSGLNYSQPITYTYDFYNELNEKVLTYTNKNSGTHYFDVYSIPDGRYLVDQTVKNDAPGSPIVQGDKKYIDVLNRKPYVINTEHYKKREFFTIYSRAAIYDPDYRWDSTFIDIKDSAKNVIATYDTDTLHSSRSLPLTFDSSVFVNGDYYYSVRVFDGQKYGDSSEDQLIVINNTIPNTALINYAFVGGELQTSLTVPQQPTDILVSYKQKIRCNGFAKDYDGPDVYTTNLAKASTGDCTITAESIANNGYNEETSLTVPFVNNPPTTFDFNYLYDALDLSFKVDIYNPSTDPEKGTISYMVKLINSNGDTVLKQPYTGVNQKFDVSLIANGFYDMQIIAKDENNNETLKTNLSKLEINNVPPIKPSLFVNQEDIKLFVQANGSADPENKKLTYIFEIKDNNGILVLSHQGESDYHIFDLSKQSTGLYTVIVKVFDGVNTTNSDPYILNFINNPVSIGVPPLVYTRELNKYKFNAEGKVLDDYILAPLRYEWHLIDVASGEDFKHVSTVPFFNYTYDETFAEGLKRIYYIVDDGANSTTSDVVEFSHFIHKPEVSNPNITQLRNTVYFDAMNSMDKNGFLVNNSWVIKDEQGNVLLTQTGERFNHDFKDIDTTKLDIEITSTNNVYTVVTNPTVKFQYVNADPTKPLISIVKTGESYVDLASTTSIDPEGQTVKYKWRVYDSTGALKHTGTKSEPFYKLDFNRFVTGLHYVEVEVTDDVNVVYSDKTSVTVFNEPPGTPTFNAIQDGLSIKFYGREFIDNNGGKIFYTYKIYDLNDVVVAQSVSENKDQTIDMSSFENGLYRLELTLSDEGNQTSVSPKIDFDYVNTPPTDPDFYFLERDYEFRVSGFNAIDPQKQPMTYRYEIINMNDPSTVIHTINDKFGVFTPVDLGVSGNFAIRYIANDGVNDSANPKTIEFEFINTPPSSPLVTVYTELATMYADIRGSVDINNDEIGYDVFFVKKSTGERVRANMNSDEFGMTASVPVSALFGNGEYSIEVTPFDRLDNGETTVTDYVLNWDPIITSANIVLNGVFDGQQLEPGQEILVDSSYTGNSSQYPVTYTWSSGGDGVLRSTTTGLLLKDSPSVYWNVPTIPGEHNLALSVITPAMSTPVNVSVKVLVKDYPPEIQTFTLTDIDGNTK